MSTVTNESTSPVTAEPTASANPPAKNEANPVPESSSSSDANTSRQKRHFRYSVVVSESHAVDAIQSVEGLTEPRLIADVADVQTKLSILHAASRTLANAEANAAAVEAEWAPYGDSLHRALKPVGAILAANRDGGRQLWADVKGPDPFVAATKLFSRFEDGDLSVPAVLTAKVRSELHDAQELHAKLEKAFEARDLARKAVVTARVELKDAAVLLRMNTRVARRRIAKSSTTGASVPAQSKPTAQPQQPQQPGVVVYAHEANRHNGTNTGEHHNGARG